MVQQKSEKLNRLVGLKPGATDTVGTRIWAAPFDLPPGNFVVFGEAKQM